MNESIIRRESLIALGDRMRAQLGTNVSLNWSELLQQIDKTTIEINRQEIYISAIREELAAKMLSGKVEVVCHNQSGSRIKIYASSSEGTLYITEVEASAEATIDVLYGSLLLVEPEPEGSIVCAADVTPTVVNSGWLIQAADSSVEIQITNG